MFEDNPTPEIDIQNILNNEVEKLWKEFESKLET